MGNIESRYCDGTYLAENPDWDRKDAPWKANLVASMLSHHKIEPSTVCEIGCGSGDVLVQLKKLLPLTEMTGYDISPQAAQFWKRHAEAKEAIQFRLGTIQDLDQSHYDVLLMLDVFEHVRDPFSFLESARQQAAHFVFHIPLDLSASSVLRGHPLTTARKQVGHLHSYTKDLALSTLIETGYEILDWKYTGASLKSPSRPLRTRLAALPRQVAYAVNKDLGVRLLGGETLLVLAKSSH